MNSRRRVKRQMPAVKLDPDYLSQRQKIESEMARKCKLKKQQRQLVRHDEHWHPYTDPFAAYLAGNYEALHEFEQQAIADESADARAMDVGPGRLPDGSSELTEIPF